MSPKICKIDIQLEQKEATAGDVLKGRVAAQFKHASNLPPTELSLVFLGQEIAHNEESQKDKRRYDDRTHATRQLCRIEVTLVRQQDWKDGKIRTSKTYVSPFEIPTSADLPSSFLVSKSKSKYCAIEYTLSCTAKPDLNYPNSKPQFDLGKTRVDLKAASVPNEIVPATITPDALQIETSKGLVLKMGTLGVAARVEDVHVGRGDQLEIFLACINDAELKVERVQMTLIERASWKTSRGEVKSEKQSDLATIKNVQLPGIERKPTAARSSPEALTQLLQLPDNKVNMDVPNKCLDSYSGKLVHIQHFVKTKFYTKFGMTNPHFVIPLTVAREQPASPYRQSTVIPQQQHVEVRTALVASEEEEEEIEVPSGDLTPLHQYEDCPVVLADVVMMIPPDAILAPTVSARLDTMVLGGMAVTAPGTDGRFLPQALAAPSEPSMEALLQELEVSIQDYNLLVGKLNNPVWSTIIARMTPREYAYMLVLVNVESDQPKVAQLLAQHLASQGRFSCEHAKAAITNVAKWTRTNTLQKVLPFCNDLSTHSDSIRNILTEWELHLTRDAFTDASLWA